jgi:rhamnulokinase
VTARFLALDLGAESGRAVVGELRDARLDVREVSRFANEPVRNNGALQWDILRLWQEVRGALDAVRDSRFTSIGVDAWGCDYGLLGERGNLLENPYHYRDSRTDGVMQAVTALVPPERIYETTGVQFLPFNTLYQLYAACQQTPRLIDSAASLATIPDLLNYWLTGELRSELTIASTTQFVDPRTRTWATGLLSELNIPTRTQRHARGGAGVSRHRVRRGVGVGRQPLGVLELGHLVVARDRAAWPHHQRARAGHELHQ